MILFFRQLINTLFAQRLTPQVKELFSATVIFNFALAAVTIFEPVFLYLIFQSTFDLVGSLAAVLWFYFLVYLLYFFILPLGGKFALHFGYERSIAVATIFVVLFYLSLYVSQFNVWLLLLTVVLYAIAKTLYWPAFHSDFARFSVDGEQGRQISNLTALLIGVSVAGPLIGGALVKYFGFSVLFIVAAILVVLSNVPMLLTKEKFRRQPFSYRDAYARVFAKKYRRHNLAYLGFGEELVAAAIWPIFMYIVVSDFLGLGSLVAISALASALLVLFIGRATDNGSRRLLFFGVVAYFFSWLFRLIVRGALGVFLVDTFSRTAKQSIAIPITAATYEQAQDSSVMKMIIMFEMSLVIGKIAAIIGGLIILQFFQPGWGALFILAALFSSLYLFFPKRSPTYVR